jgi:hypothetical protein
VVRISSPVVGPSIVRSFYFKTNVRTFVYPNPSKVRSAQGGQSMPGTDGMIEPNDKSHRSGLASEMAGRLRNE